MNLRPCWSEAKGSESGTYLFKPDNQCNFVSKITELFSIFKHVCTQHRGAGFGVDCYCRTTGGDTSSKLHLRVKASICCASMNSIQQLLLLVQTTTSVGGPGVAFIAVSLRAILVAGKTKGGTLRK